MDSAVVGVLNCLDLLRDLAKTALAIVRTFHKTINFDKTIATFCLQTCGNITLIRIISINLILY